MEHPSTTWSPNLTDDPKPSPRPRKNSCPNNKPTLKPRKGSLPSPLLIPSFIKEDGPTIRISNRIFSIGESNPMKKPKYQMKSTLLKKFADSEPFGYKRWWNRNLSVTEKRRAWRT